MSTRQDLAKTIAATAAYFGKEMKPEVLTMMCDDLDDLDTATVIQAYSAYRRNPKNRSFPLPAQIREIVCPEDHISPEAKAAETAARILGAVPKYGYTNPSDARAFIGEEGWQAVQRQGGWMFLCENLGVSIQPGTFQAQIRNQLEASFKYGSQAVEQSIGAISESRIRDGGDLIQIGDGFKNFLKGKGPEGAA